MMSIFVPTSRAALTLACFAFAAAAASGGAALAQTRQQKITPPAKQQAAPPPQAQEQPAIKQLALTDKQIEGVLAAQKEMDAITEKLPDNAKPDPKIDAQLDGVAKKNGFASYDEYNTVADNISLVLSGF